MANINLSDNLKTQLAGTASINAVARTPSDHTTPEYLDIAQSHFYTVKISGLKNASGAPISLASGKGTYQEFTPIKSMSLNYVSYENMNIPVAIFGDFQLLNKKKIATITISCYDYATDDVELALVRWENRCFPKQVYVAYLADVAEEFLYTSYDVTGKVNFTRTYYVIPASSVSVSRSYEENGAKLLNFSLAVVGEPGASVGAGIPVSADDYELGEGLGNGIQLGNPITTNISGAVLL